MPRINSLQAAGVAVSLSLSLLAGCAAPTVPVASDANATTPTATANTPAAPAAQPAAPAMPAPAASTATSLTGTAAFRGELLAGYAVQVLNAQTGEPVALKNDLAGATGLAVLNRNLVTDAKGQFNLQVVGLTAGQALLVVATKGNVRVEAVVTSNMQSLGAKGYTVAQAGSSFTLTELTTAIAKVARGVLNATQVLTPEAAAPVIAKLATEMADLAGGFEQALTANPSFANELIAAEGEGGDTAVKTLVANAGQLKELTTTIAGLVGEIATAAKTAASPAAAEQAVKTRLARIEFVGTVLAGEFANNGFTLTNAINGARIDASQPNLSSVTSKVVRSSGGNDRPTAPAIAYTPVGTPKELIDALADPSIAAIKLTTDLDVTALFPDINDQKMTIKRPVRLHGDGYRLTTPIGISIGASDVTLEHLELDQPVETDSEFTAERTTLDHVDFTTTDDFTTHVTLVSGGHVIRDCTFEGGDIALNVISAEIRDCTFEGVTDGIRIHGSAVIQNNTFRMPDPVSDADEDAVTGVTFSGPNLWTPAQLTRISGNRFERQGARLLSPFAFYFGGSYDPDTDALTAALTGSNTIAGEIPVARQVSYLPGDDR